MKHARQSLRSGFSLVEMLVVLAIIGLVAAFALPAASTALRGSQLTQASQLMREQLAYARQYALSRNRIVEVRLIRFADPEQPGEEPSQPDTGRFRAVQLLQLNSAGVPLPLGKTQRFPETVMMNDQSLSSLLDQSLSDKLPIQTPTGQDPDLPRVGRNYQFVAFHLRPNGSTDLNPTLRWFVTLHAPTEHPAGNAAPANYCTLQIDPVSGSCRTYRPTAG